MNSLKYCDKKHFWKIVKSLNKKKTTIPTLSENGNYASMNYEKAEMLNSIFNKSYNCSIPPLNFADLDELDPVEDNFSNILCTVEEVKLNLENLDVSKSNGPDGISARMLKGVAANIAPSVTKLFNISLTSGCFPVLWKSLNVVPIPKCNDLTNPNNYRPISLLPILSKVLEHHVCSLLTEHLSFTVPISEEQWGFQNKKSTALALLSATHDWFQSIDNGVDICAVFFDLKKAFDTVPHRILIEKLKTFAFSPSLIRWICGYLTGRSQRVVVNGATSLSAPVISGVPQGSVLGPLLFLIYIDSITRVGLSTGAKLILYEDDILLYKQMKCLEDYNELQHDIDLLHHWTAENFLKFNVSKCKYMVITEKRHSCISPSLHLESTTLERVHAYKYLGILITSNLSWSEHITSVCIKAKKSNWCAIQTLLCKH